MIHYVYTADSYRIKEFCDDKNIRKLHANGLMKFWWEDPEEIISLSIAFDNHYPIGACICPKLSIYDIFNIGVYVMRSYRRRGIGTKLAKLASTKAKLSNLQPYDHGFRKKFFNNIERHLESKSWQRNK